MEVEDLNEVEKSRLAGGLQVELDGEIVGGKPGRLFEERKRERVLKLRFL